MCHPGAGDATGSQAVKGPAPESVEVSPAHVCHLCCVTDPVHCTVSPVIRHSGGESELQTCRRSYGQRQAEKTESTCLAFWPPKRVIFRLWAPALNHRKCTSQHLQSRTPGAGTFVEMSSRSEVLVRPCPPRHLSPSGLTGEWGTGSADVTGWDSRGVQGHQGSLRMGSSWMLKDTCNLGRGLPLAPKSRSGASGSRGRS